jgi:NAD(P)-dependent dehydrogenase (short-subunit alcohol dehydrogenase family)
VLADLTNEDDVRHLFDDVIERHGRVDCVVHCAAIFPGRTIRELDTATWARTIAVNLTSTFLVAREAVRRMMPQGRGRVVLFSSMLARTGGPDCAHYAAAKGGVIGFARALALEAAPYGVTVNTLSPGIADTPQPRGHMSETEMYGHAEHIPMGRIGRVDDIVDATIFLLGPDAAFLVGQDLRVNGGYPLW